MAHHEFISKAFDAGNEGTSLTLEDGTFGETPGEDRRNIAKTARSNPGQWEMYDPSKWGELHGVFSKLTNSELATGRAVVPEHVVKTLASLGISPSNLMGDVQPNYVIKGDSIFELNTTAVVANFREWIVKAAITRHNHRRGDNAVSEGMPENAYVYTQYAPESAKVSALCNDIARPSMDDVLDACNLIACARYNHDNGLRQDAAAIVATHIARCRKTISRFKILSRHGLQHTIIRNDLSALERLKEQQASVNDDMHDFCIANKNIIDAHFEEARKVFVRYQGLKGDKSPEVTALIKHISKFGGMSDKATVAQGSAGVIDSNFLRSQAHWWRWDVTGWMSAIRWAITLARDANEMQLNKDEQDALTLFAFSRSTYRRFSGVDAALDSTRDIAASEVTQAHSVPISYNDRMSLIITVMDDLEYSVQRMREHDSLHSAYIKTLRYVISQCGGRYADNAPVSFKSVIGKQLLHLPAIRSDCRTGALYGKAMITDTSATVVPTSAEEADCVLLHAFAGMKADILQSVTRGGEKYLMIRQNIEGVNMTYAAATTNKGVGRDKACMYLFGVHFREAEINYPLPLVEMLSHFSANYTAMSAQERAERIKVISDPVSTQKHHRHVSMIAMLALTAGSWAPCMDNMLMWSDVTSTFVTATALAMSSLPPELYCLMTSWTGWGESKNMAEYVKNASNLSTILKSLDNQIVLGDEELDLAPLFEWNVLNHRAVTPGLMDDEILDRRDESQKINITEEEASAEIELFFQDVAGILDSHTKAGQRSPLFTKWEDFYSNRVNLTPSGSAFTLHEEFMTMRQTLKDNGVKDITKTQVMAGARNDITLKEVLNTEPEIIAQTSWKREWSKVRALFAAPTEHWLPSAFALSTIEEYLPSDCPIGKAADAHNVCKRVMKMSERGVVACLDGKNFNIFHRYELMAMVPQIASKVLGNRLSAEQHEALAWLHEADKVQKVIVSRAEVSDALWVEGTRSGWINKRYKADGTEYWLADLKLGMFSGIRYTMFYNTIFNRVYYRVAAKRCGVKSESLHSGDDVFAVFKSYSDCYKMKKAMFDINYVLQLAKCFIQGVREFLRISHKNANTSQYLARSAATCVHGRIEASAPTDFTAYAGAIARRAAELIVRHASKRVIIALQVFQIKAACARWAVTNATWRAFIMTPHIMGGMSARRVRDGVWDGICLDRSAQTRGDTVQYLAQLPGVKELAVKLVEALKIKKYHNRVAEAVAAAIAPKGVVMNYGLVMRWMTRDDLKHLISVTGALKHIKQGKEFVLAKSAGLFNTLAINDHYWGDISGVLKGIATTWHSKALAFALNDRTEYTEPAKHWNAYTLDEIVHDETAITAIYEAFYMAVFELRPTPLIVSVRA
uniref:RNA-directed RNA polymerase n=1 Tax=Leptosphaeria biglobosa quadrivirus 1 TaxID=2750649 RepID=A0A7D8VEV0_9VIRU|nr:RNA-dependent RNA polymerase [Leptosphaeria biglobosa quadrivirus 1]